MTRGGTSILVIDDNATNRKLASLALRADGFQVSIAADGESGLAAVRAEHPALVYCDIQLPGIDGLEVTRRIKDEPGTSGTVVIALTAFAMPADEEQAVEAGCDGFLAKPIDTRSLGFVTDQFLAAGPRPRTRPS